MVELDRVREFAIRAHAGQKRMTGEDYVTHPIAVAEFLKQKGYDEEYQAVALTHDVIEDSPNHALELMSVLDDSSGLMYNAVLTLTKTGKSMDMYINKIKHIPLAYAVKLADRYHNLTTAKGCSLRFIEKYISETERYYLPLAKGSDFEEDIKLALYNLKADTFGENRAQRPYKEFERIFTFEIAEPDTDRDMEEMEDRLCISIVWNSMHFAHEISPGEDDGPFMYANDVYNYLNGLKNSGNIMHYKLVGYLGMCFDFEGNVID